MRHLALVGFVALLGCSPRQAAEAEATAICRTLFQGRADLTDEPPLITRERITAPEYLARFVKGELPEVMKLNVELTESLGIMRVQLRTETPKLIYPACVFKTDGDKLAFGGKERADSILSSIEAARLTGMPLTRSLDCCLAEQSWNEPPPAAP